MIRQGNQMGQMGAWSKTYSIVGGEYYRIGAQCRGSGMSNPTSQSGYRLKYFFEDDDKKMVIDQRTRRLQPSFFYPWAESNEEEWVKFEGTVYAPKNANLMQPFDCSLGGSLDASIEWAQVAFEIVETPKPRKVRLAATNFRPTGGKSTMDNCKMLIPLSTGKQKLIWRFLGEDVSRPCGMD